MRPAEALDVHTRVLEAMASTRTRVSRTQALVHPSELGAYVDFIATYQLPEISKRLARNAKRIDVYTGLGPLSEFVRETIKDAETFLVSPEVVDEIHEVAAGFGEHERVGDYRPPAQFGFAVLDKPLAFLDHRGLEAHVHMVSWGETTIDHREYGRMPTSLIALWSDGNRGNCELVDMLFSGTALTQDYDMAREFKGFYPLNLINLRGMDEIGARWHPAGPHILGELDDVDRALMASKNVTPEDARLMNLDRLVCALWELMNRIPEAELNEELPVERHARKRAQASERSRPATVRAVRLHSPRRPVDPDRPKGTGHALDHRVEVRGHWRNQACGPGRKERKRIWIEEHERGPEEAPAQEKTPTVYVVK